MGQILQQALKQVDVNVTFNTQDTSTEFQSIQARKYQLRFSYWTMDIADPDELVTFAIDSKAGGAESFYTGYENPDVVALSHKAQHDEDIDSRAQLYKQIQDMTAQDA